MELWEAQLYVLESGGGFSSARSSEWQQVLAVAQRDRCGICGQQLNRAINVDHVLAKSSGGHHGLGNIVAAHASCNAHKGNRLPTGCEIIMLVAACARLAVPVQLKPGLLF